MKLGLAFLPRIKFEGDYCNHIQVLKDKNSNCDCTEEPNVSLDKCQASCLKSFQKEKEKIFSITSGIKPGTLWI